MATEGTEEFEGWAVLELMGHRKLAGYVRPATIAGAGVIRIDVPEADPARAEPAATQYYAPSALYCLSPVTEETARAFARGRVPEPVARWELPAEIPFDPGPEPGTEALFVGVALPALWSERRMVRADTD